MAVLGLKFLDKSEEDLVHSQSLECLDKIGVLVHSKSVLEMLSGAGAKVDLDKMIARIPEGVVNDAIKKAPKSITLGARNAKQDLRLPVARYPFVSTAGVTLFMTDLESGERRKASRKDLGDFARLADAIDSIDAFWPIVTTSDVPPHAQFVNELWTSFQNTTKHILGSAGSGTLGKADAMTQIALGSLVAGGAKELKKRPPFSVLSCSIAPLSFETGVVEAQVEYARAGVPVISMSMCMGGMTAPVTVAGTIVISNAENLASLVITQTAAPGAPQIYSSEATLANISTGYIGYRGVEAPIIFTATGQMARRYGLPKMTGVLGVDAEKPGVNVPFGELASLMLTSMSGTDLCSGIGGLDLDGGCSLEQVVIDARQWEEFRAYMRDFAVTRGTIALDVVKEVGQGNTFLNHPHTVRNFRSQMFLRAKDTALYGATVSDAMVKDAKEIARRLLKEHTLLPLDKRVLVEGNKIVSDYEKSGS